MPDISEANMRKLVYPLTYPETTSSVIPSSGFSVVPLEDIFVDNETVVSLEFRLSLNEYVALANAVDVGRDIAYGNDSRMIWQLWVTAIRGLAMNCEGMIECIETDPDVQNAFYEWAVNAGIYDPNQIDDNVPLIDERFSPSDRLNGVSVDPALCDLDVLWAGIFEIVKRLDDNAKTILEVAVTYNDVVERFGNIASAIPIIGNTIASIQKGFSEVIPDVYNLYLAYSSQANLEEIACTIFELVCSECRYPTFDELYDIYASNAVAGLTDIPTLTLRGVMEGFISSKNFSSQLCYNTVIILELFALYAGGKVLNVKGHDAITFFALLGEDSPSDDWVLLCDGCAPSGNWCYEYDFSSGSALGFAGALNSDTFISGGRPTLATEPAGVISAGGFIETQYQQVNGSNVKAMRILFYGWASPVNANKITIVYDYTKGTIASGNDAVSISTITDTPSQVLREQILSQSVVDGVDLVTEATFTEAPIYGISVHIRTDVSGSPIGSATLKKIIVEGSGIETPPNATICV